MRRNVTISDVALAEAITRRTHLEATAHGFRTTFRDWAGYMTYNPRDGCEQALAYQIMDKTDASYRRPSALTKRRLIMKYLGIVRTVYDQNGARNQRR